MTRSFNQDAVSKTISDQRRVLEIAAVVLTGLGKFIFMDLLAWRLPYITVVILAWISYILYSKKQNTDILKYWGFRTDNFGSVARRVLIFGLISVVTFFSVGYYLGTLNMTWHIIPILLIYPVWGTIQQFLTIGLVAGNLQDMKNNRWSHKSIILATAILFALVHYPNQWLILGTFFLAIFYAFIFLKQRNVFVLGLFHGWLGGLFFYTVVNRDPFVEVFGAFIK